MNQKLIYGILALAICALFIYLALLVGCYDCIPGMPQLSEYALTATHIGNLNATTEAYIRETQAAIPLQRLIRCQHQLLNFLI